LVCRPDPEAGILANRGGCHRNSLGDQAVVRRELYVVGGEMGEGWTVHAFSRERDSEVALRGRP
jgi:hypothetical protein